MRLDRSQPDGAVIAGRLVPGGLDDTVWGGPRDVTDMLRRLVALAAMLLGAAIVLGAVAPAKSPVPEPRTEVPIRQLTLSDGTIRYWIQVKVGNTSVDALLDTGTTGLRVLPDTVSSAGSTEGSSDRIFVGSNTEFAGKVSKRTIAVGDLSALSPFQLVEEVKCHPGQSSCLATQVPFDRYGIGADGLPGEGFRALIGIKMGPSDITNPLVAIGAKRWIVELPRPGDSTSGKLVLNPHDEEAAGYAHIPILWTFRHNEPLHDAVRGCLQKSGSSEKACGTVTFDSGYPAMDVYGEHEVWPENTKAELMIFDGTEPRAAASFNAGIKEHASEVFFDFRHGPTIFAGVVPYFAFDVLYDPGRNEIWLKPRTNIAGLPAGRLIQ